jgi:hypothetical protein
MVKKDDEDVVEDEDDKIIIIKKPIKPFDSDKLSVIAKEMIIKHGLIGWTFAWNTRCKSRGGCTLYNKKIIEITKEYAMKISEKMFFNTLLHEIAHALV